MSATAKYERPRVLVVETHAAGHRLTYVRLLAEYGLRHGYDMLLSMPGDQLASDEATLHLSEGLRTGAVPLPSSSPSLRDLGRLANSLGVDHVIVPSGDAYLSRPGSWRRLPKGPYTITLLIMADPQWQIESARFRFAPVAFLKELVIRGFACRPQIFVTRLREPKNIPSPSDVNDPVVLGAIPDEIRASAHEYRSQAGLAGNTFWFGVVGAFEPRKNVSMIAAALRKAQEDLPEADLGLALIGRAPVNNPDFFAQVRATLGTAVKFHVDERLLTNRQFTEAVAALDCVVLAYSTHAPNSTMGKAAALGIRCIVAGPTSFQRFGRELIGESGPLSIEHLRTRMRSVVDSPPPSPRSSLLDDHFCGPLFNATATAPEAGRAG